MLLLITKLISNGRLLQETQVLGLSNMRHWKDNLFP